MSVRQKFGVLATAASLCVFGSSQIAFAQQPAPPPASTPGLTDTPVAPPNTEAMRLAGIAKDNSRMFGSDPDNPGPIATDLSPALTPAAIEKATRKVADWELANYGQYFGTLDRARLLDGRIWTWAALYAGYMSASSEFGEGKYRDAMEQMGKAYDWQLITKLPAVPNGDNMSVAQTYLELYLTDKNPAQIAPIRASLDAILAAPRVELNSGRRIEWWWCDSLFMAPPTWARMYAATGDKKYIDYLDEEFAKTSTLLYDQQAHLYARDASFIGKKEKNGEKIFWSRGEGWVMGGIARTLQYLPKDDPARVKYETQLKEMAAAVAKLQGPDGLWRSGMLDPAAYDQPEMSGSALMTFGIAWGINNGILDRKTYTPVVTKAWAGMLKHVYADGRLGDVQQTGAQPSTFKPSASYNYGVGGFLLAGSELHKMAAANHKGK
ncbi:MAG TPA: glycoside hydrolase family 88 protein [Acidobacteriaceae bacterium]